LIKISEETRFDNSICKKYLISYFLILAVLLNGLHSFSTFFLLKLLHMHRFCRSNYI